MVNHNSTDLTLFDYNLPPHLIAQTPIEPRHASRLMVVERSSGKIYHQQFTDLPDYLKQGDILVANNSRVIPARLYGTKKTGGKMEVLLLKQLKKQTWEAIVGGKRLRTGTTFTLNNTTITGEITEVLSEARRVITFNQPLSPHLSAIGQVPLPPYIHQQLNDAERYQTVYSHVEGSAAAPTAGLHFSPEMLLTLRQQQILLDYVTLHVGLDTFKPVEAQDIRQHPIHSEWASLSQETARNINQTKLANGRLITVGTTSVRTLETAALRSVGVTGTLRTASQPDEGQMEGQMEGRMEEQMKENMCPWRPVSAFEGPTDLFIYPGFQFKVVDMLLTNFHLPKSSLLMLVSAFASLDLIRQAYQEAIKKSYRFYSFGDAMLIL